jgi:hypothetical protein
MSHRGRVELTEADLDVVIRAIVARAKAKGTKLGRRRVTSVEARIVELSPVGDGISGSAESLASCNALSTRTLWQS